MRSYIPDRWVVVKLTSEKGIVVYKILAGWYGGFTGSNSWKLSSGIKSVEIDDEDGATTHYHQSSGSTYICGTESWGLSGLTASMLASWEDQLAEVGASIEMMPEDFKFSDGITYD